MLTERLRGGTRSRDNESGAMLVELLVVMVLVMIIGSIVMSALMGAMRATARGQERSAALTELQRSAERVGGELRGGVPISLSATSVTVDVLRGTTRTRSTYTVDPTAEAGIGVMTLQRQRWVNGTPAGAIPNTVVIADLISDGTPFFTFTERDGEVDRINVLLRRRLNGQPPLRLESAVELRNTFFNE